MKFCAFDKERECNEECVAYVPTGVTAPAIVFLYGKIH